jgi:hypothetical protein
MTAVVLTLSGCGAASPTVAASSAPPVASASQTTAAAPSTTAAATATTLPPVKVLSIENNNVAALQKFADDVAAGRISTLTTQCWTAASDRLVQTLTVDGRKAFLAAVSSTPTAADYGLEWSSGDTYVDAPWTELSTSYACPHITGGTSPAFPALMDASLVVKRLSARVSGTPVNARDTEKNYPLLCDTFGDGSGAANDQEKTLTAAQKSALSQLAKSAGLAFTASSESAGTLTIGTAAQPAASISMEADLCIDKITT